MFTTEIQGMIRRLIGIQSPMNVWHKQFTCLSMWERIRAEDVINRENFINSFAVGATVKIRMPQRFTVS
jgi:hypothetical protein